MVFVGCTIICASYSISIYVLANDFAATNFRVQDVEFSSLTLNACYVTMKPRCIAADAVLDETREAAKSVRLLIGFEKGISSTL